MTKDQIAYLFATYGENNLIFISMNNNRRIHIDDEMRATMIWDNTNELLIFEQDDYILTEMMDYTPRKVTIAQGYDMLESFIFARGVEDRLVTGQKQSYPKNEFPFPNQE